MNAALLQSVSHRALMAPVLRPALVQALDVAPDRIEVVTGGWLGDGSGERRFAIIKRYLGPLEMADDDLDIICDATDGATPALLKSLMEGVKRDLVLAGRFQRQNDAKSVFGRIIAATRPGPELPTPPLWSDPERCLSALDGIAWPPALPEEK